MSQKKMKRLRKAAAAIAVQLPERTYKARVGRYYPAGAYVPQENRNTGTAIIHYSIGEFPRNRMRVAKNAVAWEVKQGRMKI